MDYLWSPWRYRYVTKSGPQQGCIFCVKPAEQRDEENLIIHRARYNFVLLNLYPYTSGHLMVAPYQHVATLDECPVDAALELMELTRTACGLLRELYRAPGVNLGMNIGECAGAGVAGHIHMHVLPRWPGDANFMSTVGETRVLPEVLAVSWQRIRDAWPTQGA
ncbi:MAG: HIT domain-containing protein [Bryobacteraceae bacterium]